MASINILTHEFFPKIGGAGIFVEETAKSAVMLGLTTTVWAPQASREPEDPWTFELHPLRLEGNQGWPSRCLLSREIQRFREQLNASTVHLAEPGPIRTWMYFGYLLGWRPKRLVLTFHGSDILHLTGLAHRKTLLGSLLRTADCIHVLSEYNRNLLQRHFPDIPLQKWCVTGAAPRHLPEPRPEDLNRLPERSGKTVLLTVGRIHPRKGHHRVLEALGSLSDRMRRDVVYWIAGPVVRGNYARLLEAQARRYKIELRFLGSLTLRELHAAYRQADIFTMTSGQHYKSVEGLGLVYLEAGQAGLPIVATHTGGVSEVVHHHRNGLLVPVDDQPALAAALKELIEDKGLRQSLGEYGREFARSCTWESVARKIYLPD